jgi:hypothetical protein
MIPETIKTELTRGSLQLATIRAVADSWKRARENQKHNEKKNLGEF